MERQLLLIFVFVALVSCGKLPPSFKKCDRNQVDFQECYKDAVQHAIKQLTKPFKEIGLPTLDPLEIPLASIAAGAGAAAFKQEFKNVKIYGFSKADCSEVKFDLEKKLMTATCLFDEISSDFEYEFEGKILLIPLKGKGTGKAVMYGLNNTLTFEFEEYEKKGIKHFKVVKTKFNLRPQKVHFQFDNLFGTDENLNKNLNQVFNENWEALYEDVGTSYERVVEDVFQLMFNQVLVRISAEEFLGKE